MFKKLFASMGGSGGASVATELTAARTRPGGSVEGEIVVRGGEIEQEISQVAVGLQGIVEVEGEDSEWQAEQSFAQQVVGGPLTLGPDSEERMSFRLEVPWETPFNVLGGRPISTVRLGLETELRIERAVDKGDLDPVEVEALPGQHRVLHVLHELGFRRKGSDLERGRVHGAQLPFHQEIEYSPSSEFAGAINELEVVFVAGPQTTRVILEADRRGGLLAEGRDEQRGFEVPTIDIDSFDVAGALRGELARLGRRPGLFG